MLQQKVRNRDKDCKLQAHSFDHQLAYFTLSSALLASVLEHNPHNNSRHAPRSKDMIIVRQLRYVGLWVDY